MRFDRHCVAKYLYLKKRASEKLKGHTIFGCDGIEKWNIISKELIKNKDREVAKDFQRTSNTI